MSKLTPRQKMAIDQDITNAPDFSKKDQLPLEEQPEFTYEEKKELREKILESLPIIGKHVFDVRTFKTPYNLKFSGYKGTPGEINNEPSVTVPENTMSIREIINRHAHGLPINASSRVPLYEGDEPLPDISRMDLAEIQALRESVDAEIKDFQNQKLKNDQKIQQEADLRKQEQIIQEHEKRKKLRTEQALDKTEKPPF